MCTKSNIFNINTLLYMDVLKDYIVSRVFYLKSSDSVTWWVMIPHLWVANTKLSLKTCFGGQFTQSRWINILNGIVNINIFSDYHYWVYMINILNYNTKHCRQFWFYLLSTGARCSPMVRAFTHSAMGHRIDPSWWTHWAISCSSQCSMTGVTKAMVWSILSVGWCI